MQTTSNSPLRFATWSRKQRGALWHIAPCTGGDIDKTTLCGKTMKHHAEWSSADVDAGAKTCPDCVNARDRLDREYARQVNERNAGLLLTWKRAEYGSLRAEIAPGMSLTVSHGHKRNDPKPYEVRYFGHLGMRETFATELEAQRAAETAAQRVLLKALGAFGTVVVTAKDGSHA